LCRRHQRGSKGGGKTPLCQCFFRPAERSGSGCDAE